MAQDAKIFRINYKSDFILTLNSDAGWMTPFCIKFWTGAPSRAYFVGFDGITYTHCAPVDGEPTKLRVQFDDHRLPIGDLKFQIGYHFTVADFPTSVEDEVLNQASVIIEVDDVPAQVMLDLNGETAPEIEFSLPAYANEAQRIANEEQRIAHEQQRIQHEEYRVGEFARLKSESEAATDAANTAATLANEKAQLAADKAVLADAAATLANEKAQLAADKSALAQAAATIANEKAALAQQKAEYAQTQGDYAKVQGDYAKAQGDTAQADHVRAEADHTTAADDHSRAEGDHTTAASDHSRAESDHTTAASDHSRAESDHTTAASDHTRAESDHTTAASDHTRAESDHTTAASDHETAASDHTRAESDHAAVELYVDSLGVFDLSKHNAVGGVLATYANLSAALTALNALESKYKYGGMSFKFVHTSDNKYVQYRLMADEFSTKVTDWQSENVDDKPTAYSKNLVESEGVERTKVTIKPGKNLLNPATCKAGFKINRNTGEEQANANCFVSDFIPVSENGLRCFPFSYGGTNRGAAVYDENKQYLRSAGSTEQYTYQSGDAYVRYTLDSLNTMVEEGTANTGYVPFNPVGGYVDGKYHKLASKVGTKITGHYNPGVTISNIDILPIPIGTTIKNNGISVALKGINDESVDVTSRGTYITTFEVAFIRTIGTAAGDVDIDVYGDLSFNDVKGNLPFNRVDIGDNAINGSKIINKSLEIGKLKDTEIIVGVNKLNVNDPQFKYEAGYFIKRTDGTVGTTSTKSYGVTGYIPVSKRGLYCNAFVYSGTNVGAAVYNANKEYIRSAGSGSYVYQDGDAYIRYSLKQNPVSPYLAGQFQVNEGTTGLPYEEYSEKTVISKDVLPEGIGSIASYEQISDDIKKDIMGYNVDISIPSVIPVVVGDRLQIFWKSIIVAPNPYIFDVYAVSGSKTCKSYPRYLQCEPTVAGNIPVTIYVKSPSGLVIKSKVIMIKAIAPMSAPASSTKILTIGASATASGYIADELRRRITTKSGTAILTTSARVIASVGDTYSISGITLTVAEQSDDVKYLVVSSDNMLDVPNSGTLTRENGSGTSSIAYTQKSQKFNNPIGLGLNNIEFVGRKAGWAITNIHQEATGGWSWGSFAYSGQLAYRFQVTGVNLITIGSTYRDSNSQFVFEVTETNITDGAGNIRCTYTGSGTIPESGTLTLVSGDSDATITYTSFEQEAGNPFWNPVTQKLDFTSYANEYCGGSIDVIISHLGMNNIKTAYTDLQALFDGPVRDFITAYHSEFPNGKFIFSTLPLGSATGGLGNNYGADYFWNFYTLARALWDYAEFARNYFATNGFDYVYVADVVPIFDCENLYPSTPKPVNNRSSVTELLGTNGVHPLEIGSRTVADAIYGKINDVL